MNIYNELKKDHDQLQTLLDSLMEAEAAEVRRNLIVQIRDLLVPHSRAEEAVLYNSLRDLEESKDVVAHSYQEHVKAETLLRGLQVTEAVSLNWKAGVKKLKEDLSHHISTEEGKVFSAAKKVVTEEEAVTLGKAFNEMKPKLGSGMMSSQMELMANLMPKRFRKSFLDSLRTDTDEAKRAS